ncbi:MAG: hypothetical protein WC803_12745 [Sphingomonas sp.]|jgi:DNA-binding Lrp family transcriptional regulator
MAQIILPDFLIIPYILLDDKDIGLVDERLYGIIYWFSKLKMQRCTTSNTTLAILAKTTSGTVRNSLTRLEEKGYIQRIFSDNGRRIRKEIIPLVIFAKVSPTGDRVSLTDDTVSPTNDTYVSPTGAQKKKELLNKKDIIRFDSPTEKTETVKPKKLPRKDITIVIKAIEAVIPIIDEPVGKRRQWAKLFLDSKMPEIYKKKHDREPTAQECVTGVQALFRMAKDSPDKYIRGNSSSMQWVYKNVGKILSAGNQRKVAVIDMSL